MHPLLREIRKAFAADANAADAGPMQAYMKSTMPFYGLKSPVRTALQKPILAAHVAPDRASLVEATLALYRNATHREERYAALDYLALARHRKLRTSFEMVPTYEELIVTGAWWDLVDGVATHRIGELLRADPDQMKPLLRRWATDDDLWKRRTSILAQNRFRAETDRELLFECIEPSIESTEFFLRKAIGWSLRELAKAAPDEVRRYVARNEARLSGLSRREALKHLP